MQRSGDCPRTLAKGTSGDFNAIVVALGMSGSSAGGWSARDEFSRHRPARDEFSRHRLGRGSAPVSELAEVGDLVTIELLVASEVQKRVEQGTAMAIGEHEAVAVVLLRSVA